MSEHAGDPGVFIRSMATRGHLGGLSLAAPQAIRVLDAAGFDLVIVETVGVGQSEVEIVDRADTTLVLLAPGMGDGVQAVKAGILEIGDIFVVNKADRFGADATVRDLRHMISLADRSAPGNWRPRVHSTVAERSEGLEELADSIRDHWRWLGESGALARRRATRAAQEITALVLEQLRARMEHSAPERALTQLAQEVAMGRLGPHAAADLLRSEIASE